MSTMDTEYATKALVNLIHAHRFRFASEKELQDGLEEVFRRERIDFLREHHLGPGDVIDFLLEGCLGVEVKVGGSLSAVTRQLHRYAGYETIHGLVLVTSRCTLDNLPVVLRGKPVEVVPLRTAFL